MSAVKKIGLMIEPLSGYGEKILTGISRYAQRKSDWRVAFFDRERRDLVDLLGAWKGDGIICTASGEDFAEAAKGRKLPIVNVTSRQEGENFIHVVGDEYQTGRMAGEFMMDRGFETFAVVRRMGTERFALERVAGFGERVGDMGAELREYIIQDEEDLDALADWMAELPKPLAVMGVTDQVASLVLEACWERDLRVPEEVAVIGVGNYDQFCELCPPPLTSVEVDMERRGYEAARVLDEVLLGGKRPEAPFLIPPREVFERKSTDVYAFADANVVAALRFIRENASRTIKVTDVVKATSISRRSLEGRFNRIIGRTIHEEIWRLHFDLATRLLTSTDFSLQEVATQSGFRTASALVTLFKNRYGMTPKEYRVANRRGS